MRTTNGYQKVNGNYSVDDFFEDKDIESPTEKLMEVGQEIINRWHDLTNNPIQKIYIVGSMAYLFDDPEHSHNDVDFLIRPGWRVGMEERENLYFLITAGLQEEYTEKYEVFVGDPDVDHEGDDYDDIVKIDLTDHFF